MTNVNNIIIIILFINNDIIIIIIIFIINLICTHINSPQISSNVNEPPVLQMSAK